MRIYGQITKLEPQDDGTLKVIGVASSGAIDAADERVAPDAMKAALPDYLRFGALREMHGMSAAGATLGADVGEDGLTRIEAHVVDPLAVKKVKLGVYKGFSIGGRVTARDPADPKLITGLKLDEISLVDRPCNPEAVIEMWKADAAHSARMLADPPTNAQVIAKAIELAAAAGRPGRNTEFVVKARDALMHGAAVSTHEMHAAAASAADIELDDPLAAACALVAKRGARNSAADLARIQSAHDQLVALGAECCARDDDGDEADDGEEDDNDLDDLDAADDDLDQADDEDETGKALGSASLSDPNLGLAVQVASLNRMVADLRKRLEQVSAEPRPPKALAGWARAVTKTEDARSSPAVADAEQLRKFLDSLTPEERGLLELRAALSRPITGGF